MCNVLRAGSTSSPSTKPVESQHGDVVGNPRPRARTVRIVRPETHPEAGPSRPHLRRHCACRRARSIPHPREAVNLCLSEEAVRPLARRTRRCAVQHADPAMSGDHQVRRHPAAGRRSGRGAPTRTWCGPDRVRAARSAVRRRTGPAPRRNCRCSRRSRQLGGTAVERSRSSSLLRRALAVRAFGVRHGAGRTWGSARECGRSPGRRGARRSAWPGCWTSRRDHRGCAVPV